jgi:hypothetical protein
MRRDLEERVKAQNERREQLVARLRELQAIKMQRLTEGTV